MATTIADVPVVEAPHSPDREASRLAQNKQLRVATVCLCNQNRSMEAQAALIRKGFHVRSFGTAQHVKLPGPRPVVFEFGTPYADQLKDLKARDYQLYMSLGVLDMLARNSKIKPAPERFQNLRHGDLDFDVIVTFDPDSFDAACAHLADLASSSESTELKQIHVFGLEVKDTQEEAILAGILTVQLCQMLAQAEDLDNDVGDIVQNFTLRTGRNLLYAIHFV